MEVRSSNFWDPLSYTRVHQITEQLKMTIESWQFKKKDLPYLCFAVMFRNGSSKSQGHSLNPFFHHTSRPRAITIIKEMKIKINRNKVKCSCHFGRQKKKVEFTGRCTLLSARWQKLQKLFCIQKGKFAIHRRVDLC